ncbi:GNAT family N-acetyltransferase [Salimicrobium album]|uniref:Protein N-acetyltransferase, RimJ/RimL family n=1 Tax=Salimicrobium album TaxID=50717 RepID=A0A1H3IVY8_9BACI|nr:GNAT family protein [Salimicrobium album]SDY31890.1 Protein N-acetyltransferase, RimJ/RimL family [Salimicrobium album]
MIDVLKGERVNLRDMEEKDWVDVHKYASQDKVCQYQPWGPNSEQESEDFVKQVIFDAKKENRSRFVFAIIVKENGKLIGAGEINIRNYTNRVGEIAYIINPEYWGLGYATEVAKLLIPFGFNQLNLHRIFATCDPRNIGSSRVLEKVGMTEEGRIREDLLIKDGWRDSLIFSILEQEWNKND